MLNNTFAGDRVSVSVSLDVTDTFLRSLSLPELDTFRDDLTRRIIKLNSELESKAALQIANPVNRIADLSTTKEKTKIALELANAEFEKRYNKMPAW